MYTNYNTVYANYLMHHGVKGQKWGVRRTLKAYGQAIGRHMVPSVGAGLVSESVGRVVSGNRFIGRSVGAGAAISTNRNIGYSYRRSNDKDKRMSSKTKKKLNKIDRRIERITNAATAAIAYAPEISTGAKIASYLIGSNINSRRAKWHGTTRAAQNVKIYRNTPRSLPAGR